jgi:hypothetical protein
MSIIPKPHLSICTFIFSVIILFQNNSFVDAAEAAPKENISLELKYDWRKLKGRVYIINLADKVMTALQPGGSIVPIKRKMSFEYKYSDIQKSEKDQWALNIEVITAAMFDIPGNTSEISNYNNIKSMFVLIVDSKGGVKEIKPLKHNTREIQGTEKELSDIALSSYLIYAVMPLPNSNIIKSRYWMYDDQVMKKYIHSDITDRVWCVKEVNNRNVVQRSEISRIRANRPTGAEEWAVSRFVSTEEYVFDRSDNILVSAKGYSEEDNATMHTEATIELILKPNTK